MPGMHYDEFFEEEHVTEPTCDLNGSQLKEADLSQYYKQACRGPDDVVVSGPITKGWGPGQFMRSRATAYRYCCGKYGRDRVKFVRVSAGRWGYLIKDLKTKGANAA